MLPVKGWFYLGNLIQSKIFHLVQTAEFAVAQGNDHKPAFNSWIKHMLNKRDRIVASNKANQIFKEEP